MADKNYRSYYGIDGQVVADETLPPLDEYPKDYDDILKFSICSGATVRDCAISCGRENGTDAVRGTNYLWKGCLFDVEPPAYGVMTIKGAIKGWTVDNCRFQGHGDKFDIEVGQFDDYWYPGRVGTKNGLIRDSYSLDGKPILVTVWDADVPVASNSNVKIKKVSPFIWFPYFMFRYIQIKLKKMFGK